MRSIIYSTFGGLALLCTTAAPASQKPCRDQHGNIIPCPKPQKPAPARCKDDKGRFTACKTPADTSKPS